MKFIKPLTDSEIIHLINTLATTMVYSSELKHHHVTEDPAILDNLAEAILQLTKHSVYLRTQQSLASMNVTIDELAFTMEKRGTTLGLIRGGKHP